MTPPAILLTNNLWLAIQVGQQYRTPDNRKGVNFSVSATNPGDITIVTTKGTFINISRDSFVDSLAYLIQNNHDHNNTCAVASNNNAQNAGPLCQAARMRNRNVRCINYIAGILHRHGYVGINGARPNTIWLI